MSTLFDEALSKGIKSSDELLSAVRKGLMLKWDNSMGDYLYYLVTDDDPQTRLKVNSDFVIYLVINRKMIEKLSDKDHSQFFIV